MRDYKHVTVPKSYRTRTTRSVTKRIRAERHSVRADDPSGGLTGALVKLVVVVMIAAAGFLGWQAYRTVMHAELFVIAGIDVRGAKELGERDLKELVNVFSGQNIFRVDLEAAARQARANPWVEEVRIHRRLPNRITMVFTERVAGFILETNTGRYLMDKSGVVLEKIAGAGASGRRLPVIAIRGVRALPGETVTAEALADAHLLIDEIESRGGWQVADMTVHADSRDSIAVTYAGRVFKMGSGRYGEKLRRLAEVMADVTNRGIEIAYVDLRPERQAAVMVRK